MNGRIFVGIDFGTTNTTVCVETNGRRRMVVFANGSYLLKSIVSYKDKIPKVVMSTEITDNMQWSVLNCKRLLGVPYSPSVKGRVSCYNAPLFQDPSGLCSFRIVKGGTTVCTPTPVDVASLIFTEILNTLIKQKVIVNENDISSVAIGIPAEYDHLQRDKTIEAASIAGFQNVHLINEPTAAVLSYNDRHQFADEYVLVYDLGGGTFDTSLIHCSHNSYEVIMTEGETNTGGSDMLDILADYIFDCFVADTGIDAYLDAQDPTSRAFQQFRKICTDAKECLSECEAVNISLKCLYVMTNQLSKFKNQTLLIHREDYEELISPIVDQTITCVDRLLRKAKEYHGITSDQIGRIILVGGATRTPLVERQLKQRYKIKVMKDINQNQCVAQGACIYAKAYNNLAVFNRVTEGDVCIVEKAPFSYGVALKGDVVYPLIKKGDKIPTTITKVFTTTEDNQDSISTAVFTGEGTRAEECTFVRNVVFKFDERLPKGVPRILITYHIDAANILKVTCAHQGDAQTNTLGTVEMMITWFVCFLNKRNNSVLEESKVFVFDEDGVSAATSFRSFSQ